MKKGKPQHPKTPKKAKNNYQYYGAVGALTAMVAVLTVLNTSSPNSLPNLLNLTALVAGDSMYSDTPKKGYVFSCQSKFNGRGALRTGSWFDSATKYFNLKDKPVVEGKVTWNSDTIIAVTGNRRLISSNGLPPHTTGEFPINENDPAYKYDPNPNSIKAQNLVYDLPKEPLVNDEPTCVGGEVGVAVDGIPLFNAFDAAGRDAVAHEIQDSCDGHPQEAGIYHYHGLSSCLNNKAATSGAAALIGFALDGFPILGSEENNKTLVTADLDVCHGHTGNIMLDGENKEMYHYHATADFPYTVGCFRGTPTIPPTLEAENKNKQDEARIPQFYDSHSRLLLPYLDKVQPGGNRSEVRQLRPEDVPPDRSFWRNFLPF